MNIITGIVIAAIVATSSIVVVSNIQSVLEQGRGLQDFNQGKQIMNTLDATIRELMYEATGAKRVVSLKSPGEIIVSGKTDKIKYRITSETPLLEPGTKTREGNLLITTGPVMDAYEGDVDDDGQTDLVLENDNVLFAIRKIGSPTNMVAINTTNMISLIRNKDLSIDINDPVSGLFIDENDNSAFGTGYTELIDMGEGSTYQSIKIFVQSDANINYTAIFTLGSGTDFIELEIRNVKV